jgi:hypothetical protein
MLVDWSRLKLKVLYGFAGGFYMYSIFALVFWETRRADFGVSMSHHIAALFLIVFSYLARFFFPLCDLLLATFHYTMTIPFLQVLLAAIQYVSLSGWVGSNKL